MAIGWQAVVLVDSASIALVGATAPSDGIWKVYKGNVGLWEDYVSEVAFNFFFVNSSNIRIYVLVIRIPKFHL